MEAWNWLQRNGLRATAALALLALSGVLAVYNAEGWFVRGLTLLAALAVITEALAFVMAVNVDGAFRDRQWLKGIACALILIGCEAFNAAGSHMAWEASMAPKLEADTRAAQAALDRRITELRQTIADAQARIDRVAQPDLSGGPQSDAQARAAWTEQTAADRETKAQAQQTLDALPVVAEIAPIFSPEIVWGFLAFLGFCKSLGLWAVGMKVGAASKRALPPNVTELDRSEIGRRLNGLRKDRQATA